MMPVERAATRVWRDGWSDGVRALVPEAPVALVYDGGTEAVMMASPCDLEDFAIGFSFNERIVLSPDELGEIELRKLDAGIEIRMSLSGDRRARVVERRRLRAGPAGCGLCGIESLGAALPALPRVGAGVQVRPGDIVSAMREIAARQPVNRLTSSMHAAALFVPGEGLVAVREDVGRHNALDKLQGALLRGGRRASDGVILMTSRVSVELVQKAVVMGGGVLAAISAPTSLAVSEASRAGLTLACVVRHDGFEVFCGAERFSDAA